MILGLRLSCCLSTRGVMERERERERREKREEIREKREKERGQR